MKKKWIYRRGDLYMANLNPFKGSEQGGTRPVLVLQNNDGNYYCPTLIVAPLTTKIKKQSQPTHYFREATSQVDALARIFGDCREGQIPRCLHRGI